MARRGLIPGAGAEVQGFLDARFARFLGDADRALATAPHLAGALSIADLALYPIVAHRWSDTAIAARYPHLGAWAERIAARPEVAAILPLPQ